jgi:prepilin-type N-terminal cleavage/methylation domain-containing protein
MNLKRKKKLNKEAGFTLIEILVVIGIIAILAANVIIAINPAKQFAQARNTERVASTNSILNAIGQRIADNKGVFAGDFTINSEDYTCGVLPNATTSVTEDMAANTTSQTGDLGCLVPTYIPALPIEPTTDTGGEAYTVRLLPNGRVQVCAPQMEHEPALPTVTSADTCVVR